MKKIIILALAVLFSTSLFADTGYGSQKVPDPAKNVFRYLLPDNPAAFIWTVAWFMFAWVLFYIYDCDRFSAKIFWKWVLPIGYFIALIFDMYRIKDNSYKKELLMEAYYFIIWIILYIGWTHVFKKQYRVK